MRRTILALLAVSLFAFANVRSFACTTFCLKHNGEILFGKNYDWMIGDGLIFVNKRGMAKVGAEGVNPPKWVSKYGSVTFNQYGWENPHGGMNEVGLVVELMWLDDTQYPRVDSRPAVDVLEWIQYQLDNSATVAEVLSNAEKIRIKSDVKLHYLVNDKAGNAATIEFLNGALVAHQGANLPVPTLTNSTYEQSLNYAKSTAPEKAVGGGSLERFARAAGKTRQFTQTKLSEVEAVNYAFEILSNVAQPGYTQWSIVYDQKRGRIYFRTMQSAEIKIIDAKAFNYSCGTAVKIFDLNAQQSGDVTGKFVDYSRKANRDLIERSFNGTDFLKAIPAALRNMLASYPEQFYCQANSKAS